MTTVRANRKSRNRKIANHKSHITTSQITNQSYSREVHSGRRTIAGTETSSSIAGESHQRTCQCCQPSAGLLREAAKRGQSVLHDTDGEWTAVLQPTHRRELGAD